MARRPETRFIWKEGWALGYQVFGDGPDLIYLPPFVASVDMMWQNPSYARFLDRLATFARVITTDRRGWGSSDRFSPGTQPELPQLVEDVLTIAAAANATRPAVFAAMESGFVAIEAAATYPDLFSRLILFQASPVWTRKDDMPWEATERDTDALIRSIAVSTSWLDWNRTYVRDQVPSQMGDVSTLEFLATANRALTTPGSLISDLEWYRTLDLRHRISEIGLPTLLLVRDQQRGYPPESSRYLAERMPDGRLVELSGADAYPWYGAWEEVTDEIQAFVTGSRERPAPSRSLKTVLFTDLVGSTAHAVELGDADWHALVERHFDRLRSALRRHGGTEISTSGDGMFATFDSPASAVRAATEMTLDIRSLGMEIRVGIHTGEVEHDGNDLRGVAVHIGARVMSAAGPSQVLVSSTVRELSAGSSFKFQPAGEHQFKGVPDSWQLFEVLA